MAVITVSRQIGSGGEEIACRVSELLQYCYLDKELITQVATEMGLLENETIDFSEEHFKLESFFERIFRGPGPHVVAHLPAWKQNASGEQILTTKKLTSHRLTSLMQNVIMEAYNQGNTVITGRGGQVILRDRPGVLHVRIEAPLGTRMRYVHEREGLSIEASYQLIADRDQQSARYLHQLFDVRWDDPMLYHLLLNTGKWAPEAAAQLIVKAVEQLSVEEPV